WGGGAIRPGGATFDRQTLGAKSYRWAPIFASWGDGKLNFRGRHRSFRGRQWAIGGARAPTPLEPPKTGMVTRVVAGVSDIASTAA
ncbi:MAG: hypothetical protein AAGA96_16720, partial [Verrucomicrobiota bacterium]